MALGHSLVWVARGKMHFYWVLVNLGGGFVESPGCVQTGDLVPFVFSDSSSPTPRQSRGTALHLDFEVHVPARAGQALSLSPG